MTSDNKRWIRLIVSTLALLALAGTASAQDEEPKWYTVEVVIFENLNPDALLSEQWSSDPGKPALTGAIELTGASDQPLDPELAESASGSPHAFQALPPDQWQLGAVAGRLSPSNGYRVLLHLAWREPGLDQRQSRAVHVRVGPKLLEPSSTSLAGGQIEGQPAPDVLPRGATASGGTEPGLEHPSAPALDGTLRLYVERYLHLDVDLLYYRPAPEIPAPAAADNTGSDSTPASAPARTPTVWRPTLFRLHQSRRMRSGELHYFDHPLLGVLALITPFEPPKPESPGEPGASQPEGGSAN
jgi:hypothetical protein